VTKPLKGPAISTSATWLFDSPRESRYGDAWLISADQRNWVPKDEMVTQASRIHV